MGLQRSSSPSPISTASAARRKTLASASRSTKYTTDRYSENCRHGLGLGHGGDQSDAERLARRHQVPRSLALRAQLPPDEYLRRQRGRSTSASTPTTRSTSGPYYSRYDQDLPRPSRPTGTSTRAFQDEVGGRKTYAFLSRPTARVAVARPAPTAAAARSATSAPTTSRTTTSGRIRFGGKHEKSTATKLELRLPLLLEHVRPPEDFTEFNLRLDPDRAGLLRDGIRCEQPAPAPSIRITNGLSPTDIALRAPRPDQSHHRAAHERRGNLQRQTRLGKEAHRRARDQHGQSRCKISLQQTRI
jgi:hypothetical protein